MRAERASITINDDKTSYDVTMDLDGDGDLDTRTVTLPGGVTSTLSKRSLLIGAVAPQHGWRYHCDQRSGLDQIEERYDTVSIDVTGSGDITVDSRVFDDSVPNVNLKVGDLATGATPVPTPSIVATPTPTEDPVPIPTVNPERESDSAPQ